LKYLSLFLPKKNPTRNKANRTRFKNFQQQLSTTTFNNNFQQQLSTTGGPAYAERGYIIRVDKAYCHKGTEPHETEAILMKKGLLTEVNKDIEIHTRDGKVHTTLVSYLTDHAVSPFGSALGYWQPWNFVEVMTTRFSGSRSNWISGTSFERGTQPSGNTIVMPDPAHVVLPRGGAVYGMATYKIRHTKNTFASRPNTLETATLTMKGMEYHHITDEKGLYYKSLVNWHLHDNFVSEEYIEKDLATNGSPWKFIDVKVGDEWMTGCTFLALRSPAGPGDDGPVPRQNAESVLDNVSEEEPEPVAAPHHMSGPVPRAMTDYPGMDEPYRIRVTTNDTLTGVIRRNGDFQSPYTKETYSDYEIELDQEVRMEDYTTKYLNSIDELALFYDFDVTAGGEAWIYVEIEVDGVWMRGDEAALELFNIKVEKDKNGIWGEVLGPRRHLMEYDAQEFDEALSKRVELNLTVTEVIQKFGPGIPVGYTFDPDYFVENYEKHFTNPEQYWEEMSHEEAMYCFGPRESRPTLDEIEEMDREISQLPPL
jgi:hypothetical protein